MIRQVCSLPGVNGGQSFAAFSTDSVIRSMQQACHPYPAQYLPVTRDRIRRKPTKQEHKPYQEVAKTHGNYGKATKSSLLEDALAMLIKQTIK